jgi:hypothetical protein
MEKISNPSFDAGICARANAYTSFPARKADTNTSCPTVKADTNTSDRV